MAEFWKRLGKGARAALLAGAVFIVLTTALIAWMLLRTEEEVLFSNLAPQDTAVMVEELDRMKLPYRLGPDGNSILVDSASVHQTRLKLMGKELPLHGAVGFELFNNADFGMTEFAQKINYQRALQGEITRTIVSLAEVETARVHIAFAEEGLFKRDQARAKASITLGLKHGQALRAEQVTGIQRLVAAAVPGIAAQDVTIVNQQGVALTRNDGGAAVHEESGAEVSQRMELKREIEQHLVRKASVVLDKAFGPGNALASVDVTLDMNHVRVTTEDVKSEPAKGEETPAGVMVRLRETTRDDAPQGVAREGSGSTHREVDYQVGRRVEQLVQTPGSIQKVQVLAVLHTALDAQQLERVKTLLAAAVGAVPERGDTVVVQTLDALGASSGHTETGNLRAATEREVTGAPAMPQPMAQSQVQLQFQPQFQSLAVFVALLLVAVLLLAIGLWWRQRKVAVTPSSLSTREREAALAQLQAWMREPEAQESGTGVNP
jgi:flagellar M-ring protein FliF